MDPGKLKKRTGRPAKHNPGVLLKLLPPGGLPREEWMKLADAQGIAKRTFCRMKSSLEATDEVRQNPVSGVWLPNSKECQK